MKREFSREIFEKYSNLKFHENLSIGSRVVQCGRMDRQTNMTNLIVAFCNITNARKTIKGNNESQSGDNQSHEEGNRDNSQNVMCTMCTTDICIVFTKISV